MTALAACHVRSISNQHEASLQEDSLAGDYLHKRLKLEYPLT